MKKNSVILYSGGIDSTVLLHWKKKEIALALENQFIPVSLGNTRLRTETAAVVACHSVVFLNEQ